MSLGRQILREILDEIETEFFRSLEDPSKEGIGLEVVRREAKERVKLVYQRSVTRAIAKYLDKVYVG
jgi:hypothetical protein